ncbi:MULTISPECIES: AraC family transcriptional regulator [Actinoalloteichus]|uniref:DNA-binding domain-containing protein, AraC-type n=1 Tax=Actinoalloteichus fjordicus TaxID=1612552 RepID=A0AAC9LDT2_9PSEU|nr:MULTISPECIES: AraC family transcriptional regulator [Actinoalloteichus]APU15024.1 DNA-binding domain-containing protein, AraC-type [Actinoalloteichus fjordicus]APU21092.1 DNA-binding domain-containing protein, AraC-type [Actinoalloteichus sp. GBA129-24]
MDALTDLMRGVRADGALFHRTILTPPWSLRFADGAPLTLCTMAHGNGWLIPDNGDPTPLHHGDTAVILGPAPFSVVDELPDPDGPHRARNPPPPGGPESGGPTTLVVGAYRTSADVGRRLPGALPPVLTVPGDEECDAVLDFLAAEVAAHGAGRQVVLDRLLDWLLTCTLHAWFDRPETHPPAWYHALGDPVVGSALRAVHAEPARPWTVAAMAAEAAVSRAAFARRFSALVGEPPLTYLTAWRMAVAADLLTEPESTVAAVARRVGYTDPFAFSAAFTRVRGVTPSSHRSGRRDSPPEACGAEPATLQPAGSPA